MNICYYIFVTAFKRKKDYNWLDVDQLKNNAWGDYAKYVPQTIKWLEDNGAEDIEITTFDNLKLRGKWIKTENAHSTIILVHGYRGHYVADFGAVYQVYKDLGFNILTFRHRAHGESQGKYITFGTFEHRDLLSLINYHNANLGSYNIFINGISMGASTALYAIDKDLPKNVLGIIADSGFISPYEIVKKVVKDRIKINPTFLMFGVNVYCKLFAKFNLKDCSSLKTLKNPKVPLLMIHGKADDFVPCKMTEEGFNACVGKKSICLVENAGHGLGYVVDKDKVTNALLNFFKENSK